MDNSPDDAKPDIDPIRMLWIIPLVINRLSREYSINGIRFPAFGKESDLFSGNESGKGIGKTAKKGKSSTVFTQFTGCG